MELERAKSRRGEKSTKQKAEWSNDCLIFLNLYRFQGSKSESSERTECTLKTAQPDGKHLVKKPVANVFKRTHERRNANNFAVGLRRKKLTKIEKSIL